MLTRGLLVNSGTRLAGVTESLDPSSRSCTCTSPEVSSTVLWMSTMRPFCDLGRPWCLFSPCSVAAAPTLIQALPSSWPMTGSPANVAPTTSRCALNTGSRRTDAGDAEGPDTPPRPPARRSIPPWKVHKKGCASDCSMRRACRCGGGGASRRRGGSGSPFFFSSTDSRKATDSRNASQRSHGWLIGAHFNWRPVSAGETVGSSMSARHCQVRPSSSARREMNLSQLRPPELGITTQTASVRRNSSRHST